ncbi:stage V sporulation protein B [Paenibacillus sp. FJAT-26967]|uniref:stage V sporulation protein B n=1 Tax=Paenibacillus sp. FJAT-26967 TaxID=1729690 RepID=UPI0008399294|nr:stage V sporulation protein B [Paenibacillus sp. FJAT-26967]
MTKQSFIKGTMILLAAGIINRILGFIPRITLPRVIGAEGVGLYQMGWPFLIVILTFVTGGIPLAVAKLVAEAEAEHNYRRSIRILKLALALSLSIAGVFTIVCIAGAKWITSHLLTDERVYFTFLCMSPIIPLIAVSAVLRGYFQGKQNMIPTATSQTIETLVRIVMVLACSFALLPYGIAWAAAGAMIGVTVGEAAGMLVLLLHYRRQSGKERSISQVQIGTSARQGRLLHLRRLIKISLPITASRLAGAGSYLLESILIAHSLAAAGIVTAVATAQYGALQGMIIPIILLPSALTSSLSVSLVPSLSEAAARKDIQMIHKRMHQSLRLALVTGGPFAVIMFVLAEPLCQLMYGQTDIAVMLKMLAPVAIFIYLQAPLQAALQALDKPGSALVNTLIGSLVKLLLIVWLASKPEFGILGAVMASCVNVVLVTLLHGLSVLRHLKFTMRGIDIAKVTAAMTAASVCCLAVYRAAADQPLWLGFLIASAAAMTAYMIGVTILRIVNRSDLARMLTLGRRLIRKP